MVSVSGATALLFDWIISPFIWIALVLIFVSVTFGFLAVRRKRKLIYDIMEVVDYGNGKAGFNIMRGSYFGKQKALNNWLDYGDEQLETKDGTKILNFSTDDFSEINGKRGIVVARDQINQDILAPINKIYTKGQQMLLEIAPAEYRDAALDIIKDADRETADWTKQVIQWVLIGGTIIFALISIIVVAQMVKNGQTEASNLILEAGQTCLKNAQEVCSKIVTSVKGVSP